MDDIVKKPPLRQGSNRGALSERGNDMHETPAEAVEALLRCQPLPGLIFDPCAGRGAISRVLEASGRDVFKADLCAYAGADSGINAPVDFLTVERAPAGCSCVVMNPPFKDADAFILKGLELGCLTVCLLRLMFQEGVDGKKRNSRHRSLLVDQHLTQIWLGRERLPIMHRDGWDGPRMKGGAVPYAWFVFTPYPHPPGTGYRTTRISWRG